MLYHLSTLYSLGTTKVRFYGSFKWLFDLLLNFACNQNTICIFYTLCQRLETIPILNIWDNNIKDMLIHNKIFDILECLNL